MIAGLPKAPSAYNPIANPQRALQRRNYVLRRMNEVGAIDADTYESAKLASLTAGLHFATSELDAGYVAEMVRSALYEQHGEAIYNEGWKVYTTVSSAWAREFVAINTLGPEIESVDEVLTVGDVVYVRADSAARHRLSQLPGPEGAFVALDPRDGAVLALVGGYAFERSKFNRVSQASRQPGSNFKPFVYAAALENGLTLASVFNDAPVVFADDKLEDVWRPENYSGRVYGPTRLREALVW